MDSLTPLTKRRLAHARLLLETPHSPLPGLDDIAAQVGWGAAHLRRLFKAFYGQTPREVQRYAQLCQGRDLLLQTDWAIGDIAHKCGFLSPSHFSHLYRQMFNLTPREERALALMENLEDDAQ